MVPLVSPGRMKTKIIARKWAARAVLAVVLTTYGARGDQQITPEEGALRAALSEGGLITFLRGGALNVREPLTIAGDVTLNADSVPVVISGMGVTRVFHVLPGATLTLINITISNGRASHGAGVLNEGNLTLVGCILTDNIARGVDATGSDGGSGESAAGGAIYNAGSLAMSGSAFNGNRAVAGAGDSGAHGVNGYAAAEPGGPGGHGADAAGGGIFSSGNLLATNCTFTANAAAGGDGGAGGAGGTDQSTVGRAGAPGGNAGNGGSASGGAMCLVGESTLIEIRCSQNEATGGKGGEGGAGGADVIASNSGDAGQAGMGGSANGGAIFIDGASVQLSLALLSENRVHGGAGGAAVAAPPATAMGLNGNGGAGGDAMGAAVHVNGGSLIIEQSTITRNVAEGGPGTSGANCFNAPGSRFLPSPGGSGGAGGRTQGSIHNVGELLIRASTIHNNSLRGGAGGSGGNGGSARTVRGSAGGHAGDGGLASGGGVYNRNVASLINCTLADNECEGGVGANGGISGDARFFNETVPGGDGGEGGLAGGAAIGSGDGGRTAVGFVTMADNSVFAGRGGKGGKGSSSGGTGRRDGVDAADGRADGATLALFGSGTIDIRNSISARSASGPGAVSQSAGAIIDGGNNLCSDSSCGFSGGSSLNEAEPMLVALADNGGPTPTMALRSGSPAINAANSSGAPSSDQRGFSRPGGGGYDIGAYEAAASPAPGPIDGFMVRGRVVEGSAGLAGVKVKLGRQVTYTDENGEYLFVVKKKGRYVVRPVAPRIRFAPLARRVLVKQDVVVADFVVKRRR